MIPTDGISTILEQIMIIKKTYKTTLMDSVIMFCEQTSIEIEDLTVYLKKDKNFVENLKHECIENKLLRSTDGWTQKVNLESFLGKKS